MATSYILRRTHVFNKIYMFSPDRHCECSETPPTPCEQIAFCLVRDYMLLFVLPVAARRLKWLQTFDSNWDIKIPVPRRRNRAVQLSHRRAGKLCPKRSLSKTAIRFAQESLYNMFQISLYQKVKASKQIHLRVLYYSSCSNVCHLVRYAFHNV
jgi:hypothetical protein